MGEPSRASEAFNPQNRIIEVFKDTKCGDFVRDQVPIAIPANMSVQDACEVLVKNEIHFAPVHASNNNKKFIGVFTFRSLSAFILNHFTNKTFQKPVRSGILLNNHGFDLRRMIIAKVGFQQPASEYARVGEFLYCSRYQSLLSTAPMFQRGWHRVCVLDPDGSFLGVLTQAMVMRAFIDKVDDLDNLFPNSIYETFPNSCTKSLFTISDKESMLSAFSILHEKNVSALAVKSDDGKLVSSISLGDIREIFSTNQHKMLFISVHDFTLYKANQHTNAFGLLAVPKECTVALAIQKMMTTKIHRVWIVDSGNEPIGVLSLSDVITHLLP